jgi:integrase
MALVTNVFRRGAFYYFRIRVPERFRELLNRREMWRSLRTKDAREARQRASEAILLTDELWGVLERLMTSSRVVPSPSQIKMLIDQWLKAELDRDAVLRRRTEADREGTWFPGIIMQRTPSGEPDLVVETLDHEQVEALNEGRMGQIRAPRYVLVDVNEIHLERGQRHKVYEDSLERFERGDTSIAARHVAELFAEHGHEVAPDSDEFDMAARLMVRAHHDLLVGTGRRDVAMWRPYLDEDPAEDLLRRLEERTASPPEMRPVQMDLGPDIGTPKAKAMTLSQAVSTLLAEARQTGRFTIGRAGEYETAKELFIGWLGHDPDLTSVSAKVAGSFRSDLTSYPVNARKRRDYRNLTVPERIAKARLDNDPMTIGVATANGNYLDPLRGIFEWAKSIGQIETNPFNGITVLAGKGGSRRRMHSDFTEDQLSVLLSAPLFTGSAGESGEKLYRLGPTRIDDWRYWLPLMAMYSGARLNELCGLRVVDFDTIDGINFFHIRAVGEHQRLKTAASERRVPLHNQLVKLGLLELVDRLRSANEQRLFPTLQPGPRGHLSHKPSKFFGRLIDRMLGEDAPVVFHSFRHTFITKMREAAVPREVRTALVGHEDDGTHESYGAEPMSRLDAGVQAVEWKALDLTSVLLPHPLKRSAG